MPFRFYPTTIKVSGYLMVTMVTQLFDHVTAAQYTCVIVAIDFAFNYSLLDVINRIRMMNARWSIYHLMIRLQHWMCYI